MMDFEKFFEEAINRGASDLHLVSGSIPTIRIEGSLVRLGNTKINSKELEKFVLSLVYGQRREKLKEEKEIDLSVKIKGRYFRVNFHFQEGTLGLAARLMPMKPPSPSDIGLNETLYGLTHLNDGLVLVTGASGVGKSTTLATMLNIINKERRSHIVTIEDPIEFHFEDRQSLVEQRELNSDTNSFASALKHALRQDPNVIMVGEIRDIETAKGVLMAAETGHLVFSTLHTSTATETVSRMINFFPLRDHQQILNQLSSTLRAVISQQLLSREDKDGRVAAREIMINNAAISNLIRSDQVGQIYGVIETSGKEGMVTMNKAIEDLHDKGVIDEGTYRRKTRNMESKSVYY
jgi:twitching motility protein PilT